MCSVGSVRACALLATRNLTARSRAIRVCLATSASRSAAIVKIAQLVTPRMDRVRRWHATSATYPRSVSSCALWELTERVVSRNVPTASTSERAVLSTDSAMKAVKWATSLRSAGNRVQAERGDSTARRSAAFVRMERRVTVWTDRVRRVYRSLRSRTAWKQLLHDPSRCNLARSSSTVPPRARPSAATA